MVSRNKLQGKYKAYRFGKHFRSLKKLNNYTIDASGNPLWSGRVKVIK